MQTIAQDIKPKLFTFFFEYEGGTYISQIRSNNFETAAINWVEKFDLHNQKSYKKYFEKDFHDKLIRSVMAASPSPITGIVNTWYLSSQFLKKESTINFTMTAE
jgi:hypothetical protein